jgi:hypothetical protein
MIKSTFIRSPTSAYNAYTHRHGSHLGLYSIIVTVQSEPKLRTVAGIRKVSCFFFNE